MKTVRSLIYVLSALFIIPAFAGPISLDQLDAKMKTVEISPVSLNGKHFMTIEGQRLCAAMGFSRLVSITTEPCTEGEMLYYWNSGHDNWGGIGAYVVADGLKCYKSTDMRLASVICARL